MFECSCRFLLVFFPAVRHSVLHVRQVRLCVGFIKYFRNSLMPYYIYPYVEEQKFEAEFMHVWNLVVVYLSEPFAAGVDDPVKSLEVVTSVAV